MDSVKNEEAPIYMNSVENVMNSSNMTDDQIIEKALRILRKRFESRPTVSSTDDAKNLINLLILDQVDRHRETFIAIYFDNRYAMIEWEEVFTGTIDQANVWPRDIAAKALRVNAKAVIFAHNHPSGNPEPSMSDINLTKNLKDALGLFDIRVLDHIVVGNGGYASFAERGIL